MKLTTETIAAVPSQRLGQGDILRIDNGLRNDTLPEYGVIINADCDLYNEKTDGVVAYLPIYAFRLYLEKFWAPTFIQGEEGVACKEVKTLCKYDDAAMSDLMEWLATTTSPQDIAATIGSKLDLKPIKTSELIERLKLLKVFISLRDKPFDMFAYLCKKKKDPDGYVRKLLGEAKKQLSDGHFMMSSIVGLPDIGYVIRMRRIYSIESVNCFTSVANQRASSTGREVTAVRIAHMTPTYQYKVSQLFAHQFSRIGLPNDITALTELAIEDVALQIIQVKEAHL